MTFKNFIRLLGSIALCQAVGIFGSLFTYSEIPTWYAALEKPVFQPPNWVFAPVWTVLYLLMGIVLFALSQKPYSNERLKLLTLFFAQLALNGIWTPLFFGAHQIFVALIVIVALLGSVVWLIKELWPHHKRLAFLLVPYVLWLGYATILNASLWWLN